MRRLHNSGDYNIGHSVFSPYTPQITFLVFIENVAKFLLVVETSSVAKVTQLFIYIDA
jgi:hypothetical protein